MRIHKTQALLAATLLSALLVSSSSRADSPLSSGGEAEKLVREANAAVRDGDLVKASEKLERADLIQPDNGPIQQRRAEVAELRNDPCEAGRLYRRASSIATSQGKSVIAETLGQKGRAQEAQCNIDIAVSVEPPCAEGSTTITLSPRGGAPAPAETSSSSCQHTFSIRAVGLSSTASYEVTVSQPGRKSVTRSIDVPRAGRYPIGIGPLRKPGVGPVEEGDGGLDDPPPPPPRGQEETRRILFGIGMGSTVVATAIGTTAALLAASLLADDPSYVAVPILAGTAVALGGTGLVLVLSNLPSGQSAPPQGSRAAFFPSSVPVVRGTPTLGIGMSF